MEALVIECFQCCGVGHVYDSFPDFDEAFEEVIARTTTSICGVCKGRGYLGVMTAGEFLQKHPRNRRTAT